MAIESKIIYKDGVPYKVTLEVAKVPSFTFKNESDLSDTAAKKIMNKLMPKFKAELKNFVKSMYDNWFDEDDLSLPQAIKLGEELIDYFSIENHKDGYYVYIATNNYSSHKNSNDFFGNHSVINTYIVNDSGNIIRKDDMNLQG